MIRNVVLGTLGVLLPLGCLGAAEPAPDSEVLQNYRAYIAGSGEVAVWYGDRTALVLDDEPEPTRRNAKTMKAIVHALDDIFAAFEDVTGRQPRLTAPLRGRIRVEVSSKVGGGLAHHGRLGVGVGNGFFEGLYQRFEQGERTVDQVFFYEIARNYWMSDMNPAIDYHTSKGPRDYGWWTVGFNNAMSIFLPAEIDSIEDMYYFGSNGKRFAEGMEANLEAYLSAPDKYNWENSWNVPLVPWKERTSVNDLMTALLIRLHRDHGGNAFIRQLYREIPQRPRLGSRADRQGARDNFYHAASLAAGKDLVTFFRDELRWPLSPGAQAAVRTALRSRTLAAPPRRVVQHDPEEILEGRQWDVLDIRYRVAVQAAGPETLFSATFTAEDGRILSVPGFYDGNGAFVIRFTPPTTGLWTYTTEASIAGLRGQQGRVRVAAARPGRRGGIEIDKERPTRFRYQNGDGYYPIAFESDWLFALDADNGQGIPRTRQFVDHLAESGFNQIVMNVYAHDVRWKKDARLRQEHDYGSPTTFPFAGNNETPDYSQLNIEYFRRLDRVIEYLDRKGIVAHLMVYVWNKRVNWPEAGSEADNRYFDYVVKRYQAFPNLVWDISKEALGYGHTDVHYITERIRRLREQDAYRRPITVHDYSYCRRFTETVDFVSVQLWSSELYGVMRQVCADMPGKPIVNIEHGGYERGPYVVFTGNYTSPETCLERAYQCVFAGTYPTHYWQGAAWNVIVPDVSALPPEERPRLEYYRHLRTLVDRYGVDHLKAGDKQSNAGFCLHNGSDLYLYYVPKECEYLGVRLPKALRGRQMTGTWFDPFQGTFSAPEQREIVQWPAFEKPRAPGFRVLIVRVLPDAKEGS